MATPKPIEAHLPRTPACVLVVENDTQPRHQLRHYVKAQGDCLLEASSLADLRALGEKLANVQVAWIDARLASGLVAELTATIREQNLDVVIVLVGTVTDAEAMATVESARGEFFASKPVSVDLYRVMMFHALNLWGARRRARVQRELQMQFAELTRAYLADDPIRRVNYARKAHVVATVALFQALRAKTISVVGRDGAGAPRCRFSWGFKEKWIGAAVPDESGLLAEALTAGSLCLSRSSDARLARNILLRRVHHDSLCIVAADATPGRETWWIVSRPSHLPFDKAAETLVADIAEMATLLASGFVKGAERPRAAVARRPTPLPAGSYAIATPLSH